MRDNIEQLGRVFYLKWDDMLNQLNGMEIISKRSTAKKEIIRIGGELLTRFFKDEFGLDYALVKLQDEEELYIVNSKDIVEEHIVREVRKLIKEINGNASLSDLMDYDDNEESPDKIQKVKMNLASYGIYAKYGNKEGRHYIGIASEGMKYLDLRKQFKIKSLRQLAIELGTTRTTISHEYSALSVVKIYLD